MKSVKSILCTILAIAMALSLVACGGSDKPAQSGTSGSSGETSAAAEYVKPERSFDSVVLEGISLANPLDYKPQTGLDFGGYSAKNPLKLKAAAFSAKDSDMQTVALQWFCANLEDATGGAIQVDVYTDKQMGVDKEILENVTTGVLDIGMNNCSIMSSVDRTYAITDTEYLFKGWDHIYKFLESDYAAEYAGLLEKSCNAICLGLGNVSFRCYANSKNPVYKASDCKGHLIRVMESEMFLRSFAAYGCNPLALPANEVVSSLQQGTIDGQDNAPMVTYTAGYYEFTPYFSELEHSAQLYGFTFTKSKFESLTPDLQNLIREVAQETLTAATKVAQQRQGVYLKKLTDILEVVVPANEVDKQSFIDVLNSTGYYDFCRETYGDYWYDAIDSVA